MIDSIINHWSFICNLIDQTTIFSWLSDWINQAYQSLFFFKWSHCSAWFFSLDPVIKSIRHDLFSWLSDQIDQLGHLFEMIKSIRLLVFLWSRLSKQINQGPIRKKGVREGTSGEGGTHISSQEFNHILIILIIDHSFLIELISWSFSLDGVIKSIIIDHFFLSLLWNPSSTVYQFFLIEWSNW